MVNLNIGVGSLVKSKVINMEDNTRQGEKQYYKEIFGRMCSVYDVEK